jgi:hypothetical protein
VRLPESTAAAFIGSSGLGGRDIVELTLAEIGPEFGEHANHVEEGLAGIDRPLGRLQRDRAPGTRAGKILRFFADRLRRSGPCGAV